MELKKIYEMKSALQKRIFNMIKKFENDTNTIVNSIDFFDKNDPDYEKPNNNDFTNIYLNTRLWNNEEKVEI